MTPSHFTTAEQNRQLFPFEVISWWWMYMFYIHHPLMVIEL